MLKKVVNVTKKSRVFSESRTTLYLEFRLLLEAIDYCMFQFLLHDTVASKNGTTKSIFQYTHIYLIKTHHHSFFSASPSVLLRWQHNSQIVPHLYVELLRLIFCMMFPIHCTQQIYLANYISDILLNSPLDILGRDFNI